MLQRSHVNSPMRRNRHWYPRWRSHSSPWGHLLTAPMLTSRTVITALSIIMVMMMWLLHLLLSMSRRGAPRFIAVIAFPSCWRTM